MQPVTILVTVATAGTPVQVPWTQGVGVASINFERDSAASGAKVYVKDSAGNTLAGGTLALGDVLTVRSQCSNNSNYPNAYWIDADTSGDKCRITYWQQ